MTVAGSESATCRHSHRTHGNRCLVDASRGGILDRRVQAVTYMFGLNAYPHEIRHKTVILICSLAAATSPLWARRSGPLTPRQNRRHRRQRSGIHTSSTRQAERPSIQRCGRWPFHRCPPARRGPDIHLGAISARMEGVPNNDGFIWKRIPRPARTATAVCFLRFE